jgi:hypothetical protein
MIDYRETKQYESETEKTAAHCIAKVGTVSTDGLTLILPGQTTATTKKYLYNKSVTFATGDKVYIAKVSGTYIVVCKI